MGGCGKCAPMSDEYTAVNWCDGVNSQSDTVVSDEAIQCYSVNNVIANKHNASGMGKEQANDLGKVFPISNKLNKSTTVEHILSANHLLKNKPEMEFVRNYSKLLMKKQSTIIDYLAKQPNILSLVMCLRQREYLILLCC